VRKRRKVTFGEAYQACSEIVRQGGAGDAGGGDNPITQVVFDLLLAPVESFLGAIWYRITGIPEPKPSKNRGEPN
jgi:hypothetical protein